MRKIVFIFFLIFLYLKIFSINQGTDFWVSFPRNFDGIGNKILMMTSDFNVSVTVTTSAGSNNYQITAGGILRITLPSYIEAIGDDSITNTGVHIVSSAPITLYGLNRTTETTDGFLALPYEALGDKYVILTARGRLGSSSIYGSQFTALATEDNTTVTIIPSVSTGSRIAWQPYNITLNQGQVYQLMDKTSNEADLSGTILMADKPIAVFSGHRCAYVPVTYQACDYLLEQIPPTDSWGMEFSVFRLAGRAYGDTLRMITFTDNTEIRINGVLTFVLNKYQVAEMIMSQHSFIQSNAPILVAQFANGSDFDGLTGDPFMMLITPSEQLTNNARVVLPFPSFSYNYLNVIAPQEAVGNITLDGFTIPSYYYSKIGTGNYYGVALTITAAPHILESSYNFAAYAYGFSNFESYGYQVGCGTIKFTHTITPTITMTHTITQTNTITQTITMTKTRTVTNTITFTRTMTVTRTITNTVTPTITRTASITQTPTPSFSPTLVLSLTNTDTLTQTYEQTPTITETATATLTTTITETENLTKTTTQSPTMSFTATLTKTNTITATDTITQTITETSTITLTSTATMTETITLTETLYIIFTPTASPTVTPIFIFKIKGTYPEPFKENAKIIFYVSEDAEIKIKIFTVSGEIVTEGFLNAKAGNNYFLWNGLNKKGRQVASGVFICKVTAKNNYGKKLSDFVKLSCVK